MCHGQILGERVMVDSERRVSSMTGVFGLGHGLACLHWR